MATVKYKDTRREPDVKGCRTQRLVDSYSRCLVNDWNCKYGIPAVDNPKKTNCQHPDHKKFQNNRPH